MERNSAAILAAISGFVFFLFSQFFEAPVAAMFLTLGFDRANLSPREISFVSSAIFFLLGCAAMFVATHNPWAGRFFAARRIRNLRDLEAAFERPSLGWLPYADEPLGQFQDPKSALFEAMSSMANGILHDFGEDPPKQILVTSGQPTEGKSSFSYGLALILARRGMRVLIVDADMRNPTQHKLLERPGSPGLSTLLEGGVELYDIPRETTVANLDLLPAGPMPPNAAELLVTPRFKEILQKLREKYDIVIIDAPPVLGLADAPALARSATFIIYVMRHGRVYPELAMGAFKRLSNRRNPKILLAGIGLQSSSYAYGYGYGYGYSYDYTEGEDVEPSGAGGDDSEPLVPWRRTWNCIRPYMVSIIAAAAILYGAFAIFNYLNPARIADLGGGIEKVRHDSKQVRADIVTGEYRSLDQFLGASGETLSLVARGVKEELEEIGPGTKSVELRFVAARRDRLGNLRNTGLLRASFARSDLAAVNLDRIDGQNLFKIAAKIEILDPVFRAEVGRACAGERADASAKAAVARASSTCDLVGR